MDRDFSSTLIWGVGAVALRLGIATPTLRTWERRYGIGPSQRTEGGHRRYSEDDIHRVQLMARLTGRGVPAQAAARTALSLDRAALTHALASTDPNESPSRALAPSSPASVAIDSIVAAASELDATALAQGCAQTLSDWGVVEGWDKVLSPVLERLGTLWSEGTIGLESEHLASERIAAELRMVGRGRRAQRIGRKPVILAGAEDDLHSLPLLAIESALAREGTACFFLGARVPADALAEMIGRVQPAVVFLWASLERPANDATLNSFADALISPSVLLGGPGWPRHDAADEGVLATELCDDLATTISRIRSLIADDVPSPAD